MREIANNEKITMFMRLFGERARQEVRVYFTGGTTAVIFGWRNATIDVDLRFDPEVDELFRAIPEIKEKLQINIELASPSDFIPELPGWRDRCRYIGREGKVSFFHYDLYGQALSKIERGHDQDLIDVETMLQKGFVDRKRLQELFNQIEPLLYKYPAIDPASFSEAVHRLAEESDKKCK